MYTSRKGRVVLTEYTPKAWAFLRKEMDDDNRMSFEEYLEEFGHDATYGALEFREDYDSHLSLDDGGEITTIKLTEVP